MICEDESRTPIWLGAVIDSKYPLDIIQMRQLRRWHINSRESPVASLLLPARGLTTGKRPFIQHVQPREPNPEGQRMSLELLLKKNRDKNETTF